MSKKSKRQKGARSPRRPRRLSPSGDRPTIALCMIARDEEAWIGACLESVRPVVDEIVLVDTGSTDRTVEIARAYGARVYACPWRNDFAAARNESLRHAASDWILVLDADERMDAANREKLKALTRTGYDGFFVRIESPVQSLQSGLVDVSIFTRLFRNRPGVRFEGIIHEQIIPSIQRQGGRLADSDLTLFHAGYAKDAAAMSRKHQRNLTLLKKQVAARPDFALGAFHLAEAYQLCTQYPEALEAYAHALQLRDLNTDIRAQIHQNRAYIFLQQQAYARCLAESRHSLRLRPDLVLPRVLAAQVFMQQQAYPETIEMLTEAIRLTVQPSASTRSMLIRKIDPFFLYIFLGQASERAGRRDEARAAYERALSHRPHAPEALLALGKYELEGGNGPRACRLLSEALIRTQKDKARVAAVIGEGLEERLPEDALRTLIAAMSDAPSYHPSDAGAAGLGARLRDSLPEPERCRFIARCAARLGDFARAAQGYEAVLRHATATESDYLSAAQALHRTGREDGAITVLEEAAGRFPANARIHYVLGTLMLREARFASAEASYRTALSLCPSAPEIHHDLGVVCLKMGHISRAVRHLERASALRPDDAGTRASLKLAYNLLKRLQAGTPQQAAPVES